PAFDGTAFDPEIIHTGELDSVPVAGRSDVPDDHISQQDVMGGQVERTTVVDIDAVASRPHHDQVMEFDMRDPREVKPRCPIPENGRRFGSLALKMIGLPGPPRSPSPVRPPRYSPGAMRMVSPGRTWAKASCNCCASVTVRVGSSRAQARSDSER